MKVMNSNINSEKYDYIDGNVLYKELEVVERYTEMVVDDLREEGFFDEDIYDYLCTKIIKVMLKGDLKKWEHVIKQMENND